MMIMIKFPKKKKKKKTVFNSFLNKCQLLSPQLHSTPLTSPHLTSTKQSKSKLKSKSNHINYKLLSIMYYHILSYIIITLN